MIGSLRFERKRRLYVYPCLSFPILIRLRKERTLKIMTTILLFALFLIMFIIGCFLAMVMLNMLPDTGEAAEAAG